MSKRSHPVAQVLRLIDSMSDTEKVIVRDYLRPERKVKAAGKSPSPALPARRKSSSGNAPQTATGASSGTGMVDAGNAQAASSGGD